MEYLGSQLTVAIERPSIEEGLSRVFLNEVVLGQNRRGEEQRHAHGAC